MSRDKPFFSIVIPTRNRHDTLGYTIKTILNQDFKDYELIICDNNSSVETHRVVEGFNHPNIRYVRSNIDLAMSKNWELAISHANGQYVTVLADNDGFIKDSLGFLHELLKCNYLPSVLRWEKNTYQWPDVESENANLMLLRAKTSLKRVFSQKIMRDVLRGDSKFQELPMLYNSVISQELIKKLKKNTGKLFNSISPDVYSGFAFAYLCKNYLSLKMPLTIGANSSKSNGANTLKKDSSVTKEFRALNASSNIIRHPKVPLVRTPFINAVADSFLRVQEDLSIRNNFLNRKEMIVRIINDVFFFSKEEIEIFKEELIKTSSDDSELLSFVKSSLKNATLKITVSKELKRPQLGFNKTGLLLNAEEYNLKNIEDVSSFMGKYYDYSLESVNLPEISKRLKEIPKNAKIAIWGRGETAKALMKNISKYRKDISINYCIDSYYEDLDSNPKVIKPDMIDDVDYIIIASIYVMQIKKTFDNLKINKDIELFRFIK